MTETKVFLKLEVKTEFKCKLTEGFVPSKMQNDREQLCATGLGGSRPSSALTEESHETTTLQDERAPLKRKSDEDLGSDQKRRLVTEKTESSDEAIWTRNDEMQNTESDGKKDSEGNEICDPSEPERRVIISMLFLCAYHHKFSPLIFIVFKYITLRESVNGCRTKTYLQERYPLVG